MGKGPADQSDAISPGTKHPFQCASCSTSPAEEDEFLVGEGIAPVPMEQEAAPALLEATATAMAAAAGGPAFHSVPPWRHERSTAECSKAGGLGGAGMPLGTALGGAALGGTARTRAPESTAALAVTAASLASSVAPGAASGGGSSTETVRLAEAARLGSALALAAAAATDSSASDLHLDSEL